MSEQPDTEGLPKWDLADRMRKSLRATGISVQEMADYLDVSARTVSNWINGHIEPTTQTARHWALRTGIPYEWYCHGSKKPCDLGPQVSRSENNVTSLQVRRRESNMQKMPTRILEAAS
jgi:transcriptional regulator with XRE-family HTH domain